MADVSIIIVSYNSANLLEKCINSIIEKTQEINYQIFIVDNASIDNSVSLIKEKYSDIQLIENKVNVGFGKANNQVLKTINSKYAFLLNPDTQLINNAIKILFEFMENQDNVACTGANLYNQDLSLQYSYGNFPTIKKIIFEFGLNKIVVKYFNTNLAEGVIFDNIQAQEVPYITGADLMIRKEVLNKVGFFDEDFFLYYEETELQYRIKNQGYKRFIVPDAKIIHISNTSLKQMTNYNQIKTIEQSRSLYYKKVYGNGYAFIAQLLFLIKYTLLFIIRKKNISLEHLKIMSKLIFNQNL